MTILGSFIRDTAYFQSRRDQQLMLNAEDFDLQFTNLINYINNKVTPLINRLEAQVVPGTDEDGTANTFLRNIGDGSTEWVPINNDAVNNYSIAFSKLVKAATGSIFATGNDRIFRTVAPIEEEQILSSISNNLPVWRKARGDNFADRAIIGTNIDFACIGANLLSAQVIGRPLDANAILDRHILDQTVTGVKFADNSIITETINAGLIEERKVNINAGRYNILDNSLENRHFPNNFLDFERLAKRADINFDDNVNYAFTSNNILDNSLALNVINVGNTIDTIRSFAQGAIEIQHMIPHSVYPYAIEQVGSTKIRKEKLNAQIRNALGI